MNLVSEKAKDVTNANESQKLKRLIRVPQIDGANGNVSVMRGS